jgi:hypothetical protein
MILIRKLLIVACDVAVILLLYYPQCWLEGMRNTVAVMGAEHGGFIQSYINFCESKFV